MSLPRLRAYLLAAVMVTTLLGLVGALPLAGRVAVVLMLAYLSCQGGQLSAMPRGMLWAAIAAAGVTLWAAEAPLGLLLDAGERFAFFATFLASLSLLRLPAQDSPLIRRCGRCMLRQPPGRRYPILALGAALFGVILNIGVLGLVGTLIERGNTLAAAGGREGVWQARRRRMLMALLRGFATAPLLSPLGLGVAVILANMPSLTWLDLAPVTFGAAGIVFLAGWGLDHRREPRPAASVARGEAISLAPLGAFCLLLLAIVLLVFALAGCLKVRLPVAVLVGAPLAAFLWLAWQRRRLGGAGLPAAAVTLGRRLPGLLGVLGNEVVTLGAAGFLGHLGVVWLETARPEWLLDLLMPLGAGTAVLAMLAVVASAQLGLNPVISITLLAGLLPSLEVPGLTPVLAGTSLMVGWSLALMSSPLTASLLILSRLTGLPARQLGYDWNGRFVCTLVPVLGLWFLWLGL
ncbi:hypothetical protein LG302_09375 [Halomonas organivorans]